MKEKVLKYIIELVFIFIIPLVLLATCFKQEKIYDENNNEVGKYLTFDNIFILTNEIKTYYNYEYYEHDEEINLQVNEFAVVNYNVNPVVTQNSYTNDILLYKKGDNVYYVSLLSDSVNYSPNWDLSYNENGIMLIRVTSSTILINKYDNIVKQVNTYTLSDNVINRFINYIYSSLGITSNWILQFIVIYTLLWLIMWFIWHILYLPLDFICSKLLFDRVDK